MKNYTDITVVLDRSGSMSPTKSDTIGGFNSFLKDQKEVEGDARLTLVQFADTYTNSFTDRDIKSVENLNEITYQPTGPATALLDSLGKAIGETGTRLSNLQESERPEKVVFVVITDGLENASREFKKASINEMIKLQTEVFNWEFVFLGANQDAIQEGSSLGVARANTMTYTADSHGISSMYASVSENLRNFRGNTVKSMAFTEEDRRKQESTNTK